MYRSDIERFKEVFARLSSEKGLIDQGWQPMRIKPITQHAYDLVWQDWCDWCRPINVDPVYASPEELGEYIVNLQEQNRSVTGIGQIVAGITWHQKQRGNEYPSRMHNSVNELMGMLRVSCAFIET